MPDSVRVRQPLRSVCLNLFALLALAGWAAALPAQTSSGHLYYARVNTLGVLGAYSWDSSHILLGDAEQRRLVNIGVSYSRRLFLNHVVDWQYDGEFLPVALESDPLQRIVDAQTSPTAETYTSDLQSPPVTCAPATISYSYTINNVTYSGAETATCYSRRWTIGEAISPMGLQWNFLPRRRIQPFLDGHGGYMYSTRPIPVDSAGSFNFTFDVGAGIEVYRSRASSIRAEYRYHHISNNDTATANPGIDSGLFQVTYCFRLGRR